MQESRGSSRRPLRSAVLVALAAVVLAGCPNGDDDGLTDGTDPTLPPDATPAERAPEQEGPGEASPAELIAIDLFERTNDERAERGLDELEWDDQLADLALEWSQEMEQSGQFEHRDIDLDLLRERLDGFTGVGENIFSSTAPVPAGVAHEGWMQSPSHRANVLEPEWDRLGIGVVCAPGGRVYATQNFGRAGGAGGSTGVGDPPPLEPIARPEHDGPSC